MDDSLKLHAFEKRGIVILDIGYRYTKLGFSGEPNPRYIVKTELVDTATKHVTNVFDASNEDELYNNLAQFLHLLYIRRLLINSKDSRVVVVESLLCPITVRETLAKVLFNYLQVSAALYVPSHMVSLYTLAVPSALSIDIGFCETCIVPVFAGYPVLHAYQALPVAGRAIEKEIRKLLEEHYAENDPSMIPIVSGLSDEVIEDIKVNLCFVAPLEKVKDQKGAPPPSVPFVLAGRSSLLIPGKVREEACEVLFAPDIDGACLPSMVLDAILKCPLDMRKPLSESLLLFGGTAMLPGLRSRLFAEIKALLETPKYKDKLFINELKIFTPPSQDNYTAWVGGSIIGATEVVSSRAVTREEYKKQGDVPDWASLKYNVYRPEANRHYISSRLL